MDTLVGVLLENTPKNVKMHKLQAKKDPKERSDCPETLAKLGQRDPLARTASAIPKALPDPKARRDNPGRLAKRDRPESVARTRHQVSRFNLLFTLAILLKTYLLT